MLKHLILYGLALLAGALIPVQAATNAMLNKATGHVLYSSLILFSIGMILILTLIVFLQPPPPNLERLISTSFQSYAGGIIIAAYVLAITFLTPRIGIGNAILFIVTGQILSAALIDHYGFFEASIFPFSFIKLVGLGCFIIGLIIFLITHKVSVTIRPLITLVIWVNLVYILYPLNNFPYELYSNDLLLCLYTTLIINCL